MTKTTLEIEGLAHEFVNDVLRLAQDNPPGLPEHKADRPPLPFVEGQAEIIPDGTGNVPPQETNVTIQSPSPELATGSASESPVVPPADTLLSSEAQKSMLAWISNQNKEKVEIDKFMNELDTARTFIEEVFQRFQAFCTASHTEVEDRRKELESIMRENNGFVKLIRSMALLGSSGYVLSLIGPHMSSLRGYDGLFRTLFGNAYTNQNVSDGVPHTENTILSPSHHNGILISSAQRIEACNVIGSYFETLLQYHHLLQCDTTQVTNEGTPKTEKYYRDILKRNYSEFLERVLLLNQPEIWLLIEPFLSKNKIGIPLRDTTTQKIK
jgi:hypothetical protein